MESELLVDSSICQQSQQIPLLVFAWTLLGAATLITALRLYSKSRNVTGVTIDDLFTLASTVRPIFAFPAYDASSALRSILTDDKIFAAAAVSFLTIWIHAGLGRHAPCLDDAQATLLWALIAQVFNITGICLIQISVCICVLRVLEYESHFFRWSIWILATFLITSHIAHITLLLLQCRPLDAVWYANVGGAQCFSLEQVSLIYYIGYGVGALTDFLCASIPVMILCRLQLDDRSRVGICVLVGFGTLIAGCAVAKTITISGAWSSDFTWNSTVPTWFTIAEHYCGIVLVSIPSLLGLSAPKAKSNPSLYSVESRAHGGTLGSGPRKASTWATARIPRPTIAKKHFSISTFGLSEGEEGSRLTLVENRFTVVEDDEDRLTCVDEECDDDHDGTTLGSRSIRTATMKSQSAWNQEAVIGLGMLGKQDTFGREQRDRQQPDFRGHSIYSIGRLTRPNTPKASTPSRLTITTRPPLSRNGSRPSSKPGTPKSPGFPRSPMTPRRPGISKRSTRASIASSLYSSPPTSAGLATIPSPPPSARPLPNIAHTSSRPTTPKLPAWAATPAGLHTAEGSRTPTGTRTPRGSRPSTPKRSMSVVVPVSKFRAEVLEEATREAQQIGNLSDLEADKAKALPKPPLELRVLDIPTVKKFDPDDATY